ncbi:hypothetical protein [Methylobacter sp. YRD-M1]|uniref:hypothetical protein n=1 Tax=Methylobacter sp. YRD-M1 TaxID=2911520 RepID=UPI00227BCCBD|nr:hypothetical protein [Methylobacter sp. YRD-M1]WAK03946.1 hypothetical protein LZ558_09215 [Methylobacter sp. YRD-M1]
MIHELTTLADWRFEVGKVRVGQHSWTGGVCVGSHSEIIDRQRLSCCRSVAVDYVGATSVAPDEAAYRLQAAFRP